MSRDTGIRDAAERCLAAFEAEGAQVVEPDILLPAGPILDLYGEDIRARAFVTNDPVRGEVMLRPDFTLSVIEHHLAGGSASARYTYLGKVFRQQPDTQDRPSEYLQVGYELVGMAERALADAEVFRVFHVLLAPHGLHPMTGDIGLLIGAVKGLRTTEARKRTLLRHLWRPRRFRALLEQYRAPAPLPKPAGAPDAPEIGLRSRAEVAAQMAARAADAAEPHLSTTEADLLDALLLLKGEANDVLAQLRDLALDLAGIGPAIANMTARLEALDKAGIDAGRLPFEASYGRTSLEYYDGFVFGFTDPDDPDRPAVATGGRYDALTGALGAAPGLPAVGGVIRPDLLSAKGAAG